MPAVLLRCPEAVVIRINDNFHGSGYESIPFMYVFLKKPDRKRKIQYEKFR
jgi:hypothetical protein